MAVGLWQVGLWQEGGQAAYSQGQFRSVFSVKLFVELSRPRPDFIDILAPIDASSADVDWIKAELSRGDRYPSRFIKSLTQARDRAAVVAVQLSYLHAVMHRYVANGPHCWAMWIALTETRGAGRN
jgi:hypothetical protein